MGSARFFFKLFGMSDFELSCGRDLEDFDDKGFPILVTFDLGQYCPSLSFPGFPFRFFILISDPVPANMAPVSVV